MPTNNTIHQNFIEHLQTVELVQEKLAASIKMVGQHLAKAIAGGGSIFWCGNGGSASDSQHLAAELVGRFKKNRRPLRSISLTTDTSVLTCVANDFSYNDIFSRQVEALGRKGDVLVGISTSGNSENVLRAFSAAREIGLLTVALLGKEGGAAREMVDYALTIPSDTTARIQESHILIGHILCEMIEQELGLA